MKLTQIFKINIRPRQQTAVPAAKTKTFTVHCAVKRKDLQRLGREHQRRLALQSTEELTERLTNIIPNAWLYLQDCFNGLGDSSAEQVADLQRHCADVLADAWLAAKIIEQELEQREQCQYQLAA